MRKLVRDKVPQIIREDGEVPVTRTLTSREFKTELNNKLGEEVSEYLESADLEELADILEVIIALAREQGSSIDEVEHIRQEKYIARGGFEERVFLESVERNKEVVF